MHSIVFTLCYASLLLLPGAAIHTAFFKNKFYSPLSWVALSYILFVLIFISFNRFGLSETSLQALVLFSTFSSALYLGIRSFKHVAYPKKSTFSYQWAKPTLIIVGLSGLYQFFFGTYTEVPADLYSHLERFQYASKNVAINSLGKELELPQLLKQKSGVFYYLLAFVNQWPKLNTSALLPCVDFANRTLFLLSVFFFTTYLFALQKRAHAIAYSATFFLALHMGINVFSFIRYYSFAPTMLALVLYFFAIVVFLEQVKQSFSIKSWLGNYVLILLALLAAAAVHTQEAMFIGIIILCISLVATTRFYLSSNNTIVDKPWQANLISFVGLASFIAIYLYSLENLERAPNAHWRLWEFGDGFWFFPQLTTLNLGHQFSKVVTLWGLLVYGLFFIHIKRYKNNLFLLAGMLSPLVTILNPFFIDTFLRHYNSTTVWRLCYLIPIHFVAADLFIYYAKSIKPSGWLKRIVAIAIPSALIVLLLPVSNTWQGIHYSRFPTLAKSNTRLSHTHYLDLLSFLDELKFTERVITDPMTGYMISGLSKHHSARRKFFRGHYFKNFSYYDYDSKPLDKYSGHLLIINLRPSVKSEVGALGQHWRANEWLVTRSYYPDQLLTHVEQRPRKFRKLWEGDKLMVYRIIKNSKKPT